MEEQRHMAIAPIHMTPVSGNPTPLSEKPTQSTFAAFLQEAVTGVNQAQQEAETAVQQYTVGTAQNLHDTMIAMEKADISLRLLMQVRNKAVEAYQEIMRTQL
jgi:flagellar hook-basal body complex protein FliE